MVRHDSAGAATPGQGNGSLVINTPAAVSTTINIPGALLAADDVTGSPFACGAPILAAAGLYVFPFKLIRGRKQPLVGWGNEATTDQATINRWGRRWPDAWVGVACKPSGLLVVDLDVKHPPVSGPDNWAELTLASGDPQAAPACLYDRTTLIRTGSGGLHLWFVDPWDTPGRDAMLPGIDVKASSAEPHKKGGFVAAPPTPGYHVLGLKPPMLAPGWLALILTHDDKPHRERREPVSTANHTVTEDVRERLAAALRSKRGGAS
ncbi:bifunctional DNA primase/polymerase [Streptomyces aidingensis]|uniref:Bifunctional DNA primase/polymerase, N-terminal n=1 Tax=Streptomyces aidingensis TaxID=910347 RepID=A0A1I1S774_9ACTN|nr:bifunctional DNA primase/polymerase [Streptomyces aidingensis]SFD42345.1 Bifunctional DNA primase/polymerase, N-terminal [Streptomyces aidingensis]